MKETFERTFARVILDATDAISPMKVIAILSRTERATSSQVIRSIRAMCLVRYIIIMKAIRRNTLTKRERYCRLFKLTDVNSLHLLFLTDVLLFLQVVSVEQLPKAAVKYKLQTEITDKQHLDTLKQWTSPAPWEPSFLKEKRPKKEGGEKGDRLKIEDDERLDENSGGDLKVKSKSKQKAVKDVKDVKEVKMNTAVHVQIIVYRSLSSVT